MSYVSKFFDRIKEQCGFNSDAALAHEIGIEPSNLSRLRHRKRALSDAMILRLHEITGWEIRAIKGALGLACRPQRYVFD